jgi:hypothetical protein
MESTNPRALAAALFVWACGAAPAMADEPRVLRAFAECNADSVCRVTATIRHADTGWQHYADRFEVLGNDDRVLASRVLRHPHVHEQPFTRTLAAIELPPDLEMIRVRANDSVHGLSQSSAPEKIRRPAATEPKALQSPKLEQEPKPEQSPKLGQEPKPPAAPSMAPPQS